MWEAIKAFLTADGAHWHEKLPFAVGFVFAGIEVVVRVVRRRRPFIDVPGLAYMFGEGMAVTIMLAYGLALAFNTTLAARIADKNGKVLAVAMLLAFGVHIINRWFSRDADDH